MTHADLFATMVGTLQLSRALADCQPADAVLEQSVQNALAPLALGDKHVKLKR
jgi:TetR/AcrR family transcriptional repressor of nem operon